MLELAIMVLAAYAVWDLYKAHATHTRRNFVGRLIVTAAALGFAALSAPWPEWVVLGFAISVTAVKAGPAIIKRLVTNNEPPAATEEEVNDEGRA